MSKSYWCIGDPGVPNGTLVCIHCGEPVDESIEYNEAEECAENGYKCFGCGLFTWKAHVI